jgi:hypothetical protein
MTIILPTKIELEQMIRDGMTLKQMTEKYEVSMHRIMKELKENKLKTNRATKLNRKVDISYETSRKIKIVLSIADLQEIVDILDNNKNTSTNRTRITNNLHNILNENKTEK